MFTCLNDNFFAISATARQYIKLQPVNILVFTFQVIHRHCSVKIHWTPTVQEVAAAGASENSHNAAVQQQHTQKIAGVK